MYVKHLIYRDFYNEFMWVTKMSRPKEYIYIVIHPNILEYTGYYISVY